MLRRVIRACEGGEGGARSANRAGVGTPGARRGPICMPPTRALALLALSSVLFAGGAAHADIAPPMPLVLRLASLASVAGETRAPAAEVQRVVRVVRAAVRERLPAIERCARGVHGGFSWRDAQPRRARVRLSWEGASTPSEARVAASEFAGGIDACILTSLRTIEITPAPTGRVALTLGVARD